MGADGLIGVSGRLVVEFAEGIAGPTCGMLLRELGARVVKVEPPGGDWSRTTGPPWVDGESPMFLAINRGKESVELDVRTPSGARALRALMGHADVVIQGYRPGVAERHGVGPELTERHPRLVYCSISGYGGRGPLRERPGSDTILQAYAGLMSLTGEDGGGPLRVGTPIADTSAGAYAALGVLALLLQRERSGRGGTVDTSLLEALLHVQAITYATFAAGAPPRRLGTRSGISAVPAEAFATADGHLMLSCHGDRQWRRLCAALEHPEWEAAAGMATNEERVVNHDTVVAALGEVLATRTSAEWMAAFEAGGVNAGPIQTFDDLVADAHVQALRLLRTAPGGFGFVAPPLAFDGEPRAIADDPPRVGEHTGSVLAELERAPRVSKLVTPPEAADRVEPGCGLALGGVLHANRPAVLVRELVRRGIGELVLYSAPGSGWDADLLIGAGLVRRALLPMVTFGAIGLAPSFRGAVERGELEAPCFDAMTLVAGYLAAGYGHPFHLIRSVEGTDITADAELFETLTDSTGARHRAVRALAPDVCVLHVEEADERGNVRHRRGRAADLLMVRAARRTVVFAERIVARSEVRREPHRTTVPAQLVDAVVEAPFGAHPAATADYAADDDHLRAYHRAAESRRRGDAAAFEEYLRRFVHGAATPEAYASAIGGAELEARLREGADARVHG